MGQYTLQHPPQEILRCIIAWAVPRTDHPWGARVALGNVPLEDDDSESDLDSCEEEYEKEYSDSLQLLPMSHVCQAWRAAVQPHLWKHIRVSTIRQMHLFELLTRLPWLTHFVENLAIEMDWYQAFYEMNNVAEWHDEIEGEMEDFFFGDRQLVLDRLVSGDIWEDYDDMPENFRQGVLKYFSQGPDGTRFHPVIKSTDDAIKSLESSLLRLRNLRRVAWQTAILPMSSFLCRFLSQLGSLQALQLGQQGEFRSSKRLPAPLWEIFSKGRQLDALSLCFRVLPYRRNRTYEAAFEDESHALFQALKKDAYGEPKVEIPLLQSERLLSAPLEAIPPMERALAMATRLLEACANNRRALFICLDQNSEPLLQFRHLVHIWVTQPVTTEDLLRATADSPHEDPWLFAATAVRPALMELASGKQDRRLTASEIASLPDGRDLLEPFATWLREDVQVQKRVADAWNSVVEEGQDRSLPLAFSGQRVHETDNGPTDVWMWTSRGYGPWG